MSKVTDRDQGLIEMVRRLGHAADFGASLTVGLIGDEADAEHSDGLTIAELGEIHEFGLGVPRRSFIADWSDENEEEHKRQIVRIAAAVVRGKLETFDEGLERLGVLFVAEIQKGISDGIPPPNAESTIARKGSSTPLIDTGVLRSSITYKVE